VRAVVVAAVGQVNLGQQVVVVLAVEAQVHHHLELQELQAQQIQVVVVEVLMLTELLDRVERVALV
jgi:hypothetical protein